MSTRNYRRIFLHILLWILYIIYDTINTSWGEKDYFDFTQIHKVWANIPLIMVVVYINLYVLMPTYLYTKRYFFYGLSLALVVICWALLTRFIGFWFWLDWDKENMYYKYITEPKHFLVPLRITRNALRLYPILALTMMIKLLKKSYQKEKLLRATELERHTVELSYLRAQIHPHIFFNTLNSLYSLTLKKSEKAPDIIMRMSGLMRYMLYETNSECVPLEEEITQLKNYISIEELRFGDRIEYSFQISGPISGKRISPLLLLPFVENAFKHSLRNELNKAWITITLKVSGYHLYFLIENSFTPHEESNSHKGIGLVNVKKRLALSYPDHELVIEKENNIFSANLKLRLDEKN